MIRNFCLGVLLMSITCCTSTQNISSVKGELWTFISSKEIKKNNQLPNEYVALRLDTGLLGKKLRQNEISEITMPTLDLTLITVRLKDSGTMSPALAKKFPNIKSYKADEIGNRSTKIRIDKNSSGLFAMIRKGGKTYFVNPVEKGSTMYIVYDKQHAVKGGNPFIDQVIK